MAIQLPDDLRRELLSRGRAVLALLVNNMGSVIIKLPISDIEGFRGPAPILYRYELGRYSEGSAIRLYLEIQDQPKHPYMLETFLNPGSDTDLPLLRQLCRQDVLHIHFFDMQVQYQYSKRVRHRQQQRNELAILIHMALDHLEAIPVGQRDFAKVKSRYQADTPL